MNVEVWHFLVSRNRHLDYRTVVAPDFICKANISNLLARVADGGLTESNHGFIRQITGSKVGNFTIVFRVINGIEKYLNSEGRNETLKDSFGREIYIIEGIVVKGIRSKKDFHITNQYIEEAHNFLMEGYRQFWEYREPHPAIPSHKFSLKIDSSSNPLQLEELEAFQVSSKDRNLPSKSKLNLVAFIVPIIVVLMVAIWLTTISYPVGKSMVDGCTTTEEIDIPFKNKDKVDSILNDQQKKWQKDYPKAEIFLNGSLTVESLDKLKFLREREKLTNSTKYTIDLDTDNSLQMQDHPLDLAIAQFHNHKVAYKPIIKKPTIKLKAKIINKKECIKSTNPKQV